jgi:hypothetical protein
MKDFHIFIREISIQSEFDMTIDHHPILIAKEAVFYFYTINA